MAQSRGPPHLALNPPYLFGLLCLVVFFGFFQRKQISPKKGISAYISVSPFASPYLFISLPFLTLSLFLCLSCSLFSFLLPCFLSILLSFASLFLSVCFFALFLCFCFIKRNNIKTLNYKVVLINPFCFGVFCLVLSFQSLFLTFFFLVLSRAFLFNINVFMFQKKTTKRTPTFGQEGGGATKHFLSPVLCKMWKVIVFFWGPFGGKFWLMFNKHYRNRYFSTCLKAKNTKKGPSLRVIIWSKLGL